MTEHMDIKQKSKSLSELTRIMCYMYDLGDFKSARLLGEAILRRELEFNEEDIVKAQKILQSTETDKVVLGIGVGLLFIIIILFYWAVSISH